MKLYDVENKRLLYFKKKLGMNNFWNNHWLKYKNNLRSEISKYNSKSIVCRITKCFLSQEDGHILEGGCGLGYHVYSLKKLNYNIIGIDNAEETVKMIKKEVPEINVELGDVRKLSFSDNFFVGYWSLGVIEHFIEGYKNIAKEMYRIIKPKGYLFLTFPYMSPFRKFKTKLHLYKIFNSEFYDSDKIKENFYQYYLNKDDVIKNFEMLGFNLNYQLPLVGIKGIKDEIFFLKFFINRCLQLLYNANKPEFLLRIKGLLDKFFVQFSANTILLVFRKR